ncbi:hypothetical protein HID58_090587 [Brassica napus]|uniref:FAD-binding PCMH-type domain-containing protein n=1 Tax=Brassica napus TaxID=3708 RepID=A0ABQ7WW84_BRANA|nr:hypothetical protein HID58_090587 [Brassica napus]
MYWNPYGGVMDEISAAATAFPHRKGNLFKVQYYAIWNEDNLGFMRDLHNVAESVGGNSSGETNSVAKDEIYGSKGTSSPVVSPSLCGFGEWVERLVVAVVGPRGRSARDRVSRLSLFRRAWVLFLWVWCVLVDPSTTSADGRLCRLSGRVLFLLTSNLLFAVHDLFSRLDSIRSRHLLHKKNLNLINTMRRSCVFSVVFFLLFLSLPLPSLSQPSHSVYNSFLKCFSKRTKTPQPQIAKNVFSPTNPAYSSVLRAYIRNARFNTSSTPKPTIIVTPRSYSHVSAAVLCSKPLNFVFKIRSGGHDYDGLSYISDKPFFVLDMSNIRDVSVDVADNSAWISAGATLGEYMAAGAVDMVHKWQFVGPKTDRNLFMRMLIQPVTRNKVKTVRATVVALFLGKADDVVSLLSKELPELALKKENCTEMTWFQSALWWDNRVNATQTDPKVFLDRNLDSSSFGRGSLITLKPRLIQGTSLGMNRTKSPQAQIAENVFSPTNPSYSSVLRAYIRNARFNTSSTPKPTIIVTPRSYSHVSAAVLCSKPLNFVFKIRSGGHDYDGLSYVSGKPFFILDMSNLRDVTVNITDQTAWISAGATLGEYMDAGAVDMVHKWQFVGPKTDRNLFMRMLIQPTTRNKVKTVRASVVALFLGRADDVVSLLAKDFPELGLKEEACKEMTWIQSALWWDNDENATQTDPKVFLDRDLDSASFGKRKSDYIKTAVDPDNFFRNEQSIPTLPSKA